MSSAEQLGLLRGELVVGQDPAVTEVGELAELVSDVDRGRGRRGGHDHLLRRCG